MINKLSPTSFFSKPAKFSLYSFWYDLWRLNIEENMIENGFRVFGTCKVVLESYNVVFFYRIMIRLPWKQVFALLKWLFAIKFNYDLMLLKSST